MQYITVIYCGNNWLIMNHRLCNFGFKLVNNYGQATQTIVRTALFLSLSKQLIVTYGESLVKD